MDNETITRLAFAAKNGNERSFEELYTAFYQKVYALARTTMKNDADAEDVLQQTFISAWTNIGKLDDPAAFNTWIQRITLNQCYSMLRKRRIDIPIDVSEFDGDDDEPMQIESDVMLPEVYAEKEDLKIRLGHIIDDLSDVQRQTIMLFYFDEMSVAEIAAAMDCSENTVKSRLFLARKAIKTEIEERERKSGERFYAIAGLPMIAFGRLFIAQVKSTLISPAAASSVISRIAGHPVSVTARPDAVSARPGGSESGNLRPAGTPAPSGAGPNAARTVSSAASRISSSVSSGAAATAAKTAGATTATVAAKGIFATLGAKIAAGVIAGAIVVGGAVTAAVVIKKAHDGKATAKTEVEESVRSDDTDGEAEEEENYVDAYSAYLDLIVEKKDELDSYDWDGEYNQLKPKGSGITMRPIVLCDVYGDKTPELIYLSVTEWMSIPTAALNIVTYEDSEIKSLYFDEHYYGTPGAGEFRPICFYQLNGDRTLRVYESSEFNGLEIAEYSEFTEQNGALVKTQTLGFLRVHGGDVNGQPEYSTSYTRYGAQITEEEFNAAVKEQQDKTQTILLSNPLNGNFVKEFTAANGSPAMTWQEAVDLLRSLIGSGQTGEKTKKTEDFSPVAVEYAYSAYLDLIVEKKDELDSCDWDGNYANLRPKGSGVTMRHIVLCDVYGDKTPELIYLSVTDWMSIPTASLNIVTYENGGIKTLYFAEHYYAAPAAGGIGPFCFYQLKGDKTLRVYEWSADDWVRFEYSEFTEQNGALVKTQTLEEYVFPGYEGVNPTYTHYGSQITEEEFNAAVKEQEEKTQTILLSNPLNGNFVKEFIAANGSPAMTWQEAVDLLRSLVGSGQTGEKTKKTEDFSPVAGEYVYSTGLGAWWTTLRIEADGAFTGRFEDWNLSFAECIVSDFHGKFANMLKIDDHTYIFDLDSLEYDSEAGKEELIDNDGSLVNYIYTAAAPGIQDGKTFYFYMKGTPVDTLPKVFVGGINYFGYLKESDNTLSVRGIYNEIGDGTFFCRDDSASENGDENAADASAGWSDAYKDFLLNEKFMESDEYKFFEGELFETDIDSIYIGMYDVSGDGVPELFMSNQCGYFADATNYVFTVENGEVRYIGNAGSRAIWLDIDVTGAYPGVFCLSGSYGVYHCNYYTVRDNKVLWETVFVLTDEQGSLYYKEDDTYERGESERFGQIMYHKKTDDLALYECAKRAVAPEKFFTTQHPNPATLSHFSLSEIRSMGWDAFVASVD